MLNESCPSAKAKGLVEFRGPWAGPEGLYLERGNVLVLILVAIALLAALSMAIMRSDVTDADSVAPEQARVIASQIMAQARTVEGAVKTLIAKGCSEQTVNFENTTVAGYTNVDAPADETCDVFKRAGAGLAWPIPPTNSNDGSNWLFLGGNAVDGVTTTDDGACASGCIDLMAVLPHVGLNVCKQLNALAGVTAASTAPPVDTGDFNATTKIAGFNATAVGDDIDDAGTVLQGRHTGCFEPTNVDGADDSGTYWFYHVLLVR
jgi:type II secretory pathway pseudopilin PulG